MANSSAPAQAGTGTSKDGAQLDPGGEHMSLQPAVRIRGLRKTFRAGRRGSSEAVFAVDGIDLDVQPGQLVVLLGPSGCGKTTLLRSVAGLERPDEGLIEIGGQTVFSSAKKLHVLPEDRGVGMMFQSYALWPHMTVYKNIAYPLTSRRSRLPRHEVPDHVRSALRTMGLEGIERRYPGELSGGQQQRVALARALVTRSPVLLFDEPLSNVDAKVRKRLRAELREIKRAQNFAAIYVTHDQEEAMELADVLVVMSSGRVQQIGHPQEVYNAPRSLGVAEFVGEMNRLRGVVSSVSAEGFSIETDIGSVTLQPPRDVAVGDRGSLALRPEDVRVSQTAADSAAGALAATVVDVVFLGARTETHVVVDGTGEPRRLIAGSARGQGSVAPAIGAHVSVSFQRHSRQWLPE